MTLVYHRVPECGGDTISPWLDKWTDKRMKSLVVGHSAELAKVEEAELRRIAMVSGPFGTMFWPLFAQPVNAVMILRDPVDRIISLYARWYSAPAGSNLREIARRGDIYAFARDPHVLVTEFVDNAQTWTLFADPAARARSSRKDSTPEQVIAGALERLDALAAVGTYERWDQTVALLSRVFSEVLGNTPAFPERPFEQLTGSLAQIDRERLAAALGPRITMDMKLHQLVSDRLDSVVQAADRDRRRAILGLTGSGETGATLDPLVGYLFSRVDVLETMLGKCEAMVRELSRRLEKSRAAHQSTLKALASEQAKRAATEQALEILKSRHASASESLARIKSKGSGLGNGRESPPPPAG